MSLVQGRRMCDYDRGYHYFRMGESLPAFAPKNMREGYNRCREEALKYQASVVLNRMQLDVDGVDRFRDAALEQVTEAEPREHAPRGYTAGTSQDGARMAFDAALSAQDDRSKSFNTSHAAESQRHEMLERTYARIVADTAKKKVIRLARLAARQAQMCA